MSRYRGPRRRLIRKFDNLPGLTTKRVNIHDRNPRRVIKTPGQHGQPTERFLKKLEEEASYGWRLLEKQKLRFNYHLNERQFVGYVNKAKNSSQPTGKMLLCLLEMRLDNLIYRLGMAKTILAARQLVNHGHILVNQKKVTIPSYGCRPKDVISVCDRVNSKKLIRKNLKIRSTKPPEHLKLSRKNLMGIVKKVAPRKSIEFKIRESAVVEYYSKN